MTSTGPWGLAGQCLRPPLLDTRQEAAGPFAPYVQQLTLPVWEPLGGLGTDKELRWSPPAAGGSGVEEGL